MSQNVRFYFGTQAKYNALQERNPLALYFIEDTQRLYKGNILLAVGTDATSMASGLMSSEDKVKLDTLVTNGNLTAVDNSIIISTTDGGKSIGVQVSKTEGNLIKVKDDGLFANIETLPLEKVLGLVDRLDAIEKAAVGGIRYKGNVPTVNDLPNDAVCGDLYEVLEDNSEWCFNGEEWFRYGNSTVFTPVAGDGIEIVDSTFSVKIAEEHHGLVMVDGAMALALATVDNDGAMSKEDKAFIGSIPEVYVAKKYEITAVPIGTLVNYGEKEIRIMCPSDAVWTKQAVGTGGDPNCYYATFKTYAPNDEAVGYIEHLNGQVDSEILTNFSVDEHGRRYQPTWLSMAKYDEATGVWSYYGKNSSEGKYVGWDYQIDWFNADGVMIASDSIRINLSNEDCHNTTVPYYMNNYATIEHVEEAISKIENSYSWSEM
jgi:hypothetical protein